MLVKGATDLCTPQNISHPWQAVYSLFEPKRNVSSAI